MFKKILVPYDLSEPSKKALQWAIYMGVQFQAELEIYHVLPLDKHLVAYDISNKDKVAEQLHKDIDADIRLFADPGLSKGLKSYDIVFHWGESASSISQEIEDKKPDLVVMSTHGWSGLKHFFLGSKTEQIVRHSKVPVLVVRQTPHWPFKNILVPVDFSGFTEEACLMATQFSSFESAQFQAFHAITLPDIVHYAPHITDQTRGSVQQQLEETTQKQLDELKQKHTSLSLDTSYTIGPPADEICRQASESQTDLIVMPSHGHSGLKHMLMGSVAENVVRYAPCSVLTFHSLPSS